jgi:hypothetical protein
MNVSDAAASGDKLKLLYALRDRIAEEIEDCAAVHLSPLTRRLQDIVTEIDTIEERNRQEVPGDGRGKRTGGGWDPAEL